MGAYEDWLAKNGKKRNWWSGTQYRKSQGLEATETQKRAAEIFTARKEMKDNARGASSMAGIDPLAQKSVGESADYGEHTDALKESVSRWKQEHPGEDPKNQPPGGPVDPSIGRKTGGPVDPGFNKPGNPMKPGAPMPPRRRPSPPAAPGSAGKATKKTPKATQSLGGK